MKHRLPLCLLLAAVCGGYAGAQKPANDNEAAARQDTLNTEAFFRSLPEVMVKGERPIAKLERGQLSYDMPLLLKQLPADNAFEALGLLPGVSVEGDQLSFAAQHVTLIINGKPTTLTYAQVAERLKAMPADRLAKAEVMLAAPARYHVRGAAINVVTKDHAGKYQTSGQVQGIWKQAKQGTGQLKGSLQHTAGKFSLDIDYAYADGHAYAEADHDAQHPLGDERIPYFDHTENRTAILSHDGRIGMDYAFADNHRLSMAYTGKRDSYTSRNRATGSDPSAQTSDGHTCLHNLDATYTLPVGLQLSASYTRYKAPKQQHLDGSLNGTERDLTADSDQKIDKYLFTADQTHTLRRGWGLSYGGKAQLTSNRNFQTTRTADGATLPEATTAEDYDEHIANAYAGFSKQWSKGISVEASVTAEYFHSPRWHEWRVYPSLNAFWQVNSRHLLNLSLSSESAYPDYWSTMGNIHYSTVYSEIWGNPDLKPDSEYNLSLMWQLDRRYTFVAFADIRRDYFVQLPYQPSDRMAVIMRYVNFNHRYLYGLQSSAQFKAGAWLTGNASLTVFCLDDRCDDFFDLPFHRRKAGGMVGGTASALLSRRANLRLIVNPRYQFPAVQGVYDIGEMFTLNATLHWASANGKWAVAAVGKNLTNRRFDTRSTWGNQDFRMRVCQDWVHGALTVTYKFGRYKEKKIKEVDTSRMGH